MTSPPPFRAMDAWVPHRGAMSLLDGVESHDDLNVVARVRVPAQGLFCTPDGVPAWVGIEYMAQAVAAWSGACNRHGGGSPRIGYLLGSRRYEAAVAVFPVGAELLVQTIPGYVTGKIQPRPQQHPQWVCFYLHKCPIHKAPCPYHLPRPGYFRQEFQALQL